jgi:hypothetical protein
MNDRVSTLLGGRRERLTHVLGRYLSPTRGPSAPPHVRQHLIEEATDLYWNELEWEHITGDAGDEIERVFAGRAALVRGLLLRGRSQRRGCRAASGGRGLLRFRPAACSSWTVHLHRQDGRQPEKVRRELDMTDRLSTSSVPLAGALPQKRRAPKRLARSADVWWCRPPPCGRAPLLVAWGGAKLAPGNTLVAFQRAVELWRADVLETDVHLSRRRVIVTIPPWTGPPTARAACGICRGPHCAARRRPSLPRA